MIARARQAPFGAAAAPAGLSPPGRRRHTPLVLAALLLSLLAAGCRSQEVDATYGQRRNSQGKLGGGSVNGTAVLAEMFRIRGCRVRSTRRLTPRLDRADAIVWAPDDFDPPNGVYRDQFEQWLTQGGKTLIYIGRDYDAEPSYWEAVQQGAPADQMEELLRREALARSRHDSARAAMPASEDADWFTVERNGPLRKVERLEGPYSTGKFSDRIDPAETEIYVQGLLTPPDDDDDGGQTPWDSPPTAEVLLSGGGDPLIYRLRSPYWGGSQILVVVNGSMVLNLPLVNAENRKLAGMLIDETLPADEVVFLESGPGGPPIRNSDSQDSGRSGWEAFTIYPLGVILMHLAVAGILFCFARFAIFGRPRSLPEGGLSDFGQHISALARMLELTGDAEYARARLRHYNQTARRDSGASHVKPKK